MQTVEQFVAYDDENRVYSVVARQSRIDTGSLDGGGSIGGLKEYRLADGSAVNQLSDTEFKIVTTGRLIRRR
jgi:hypothetical protein